MTASQLSTRRQLEDVLGRPEFHRWERRHEAPAPGEVDTDPFGLMKAIKEGFRSLGDTVGDWVRDLFFNAGDNAVDFSGTGDVIMTTLKVAGWALTIVVALFLIVLTLRRLKQWEEGHAGKVVNRRQVKRALESGEALVLDGDQWLAEADRLAAAGDMRAVYRALYLALLSGLHSREVIDFRRSRTNWVYVQRFRGADGERSLFERLTGRFDQVWYGQQNDPDGIEQSRADVRSLIGGGS